MRCIKPVNDAGYEAYVCHKCYAWYDEPHEADCSMFGLVSKDRKSAVANKKAEKKARKKANRERRKLAPVEVKPYVVEMDALAKIRAAMKVVK
jgi:hypothetical protein